MREIKFRGIDENGYWEYGNLVYMHKSTGGYTTGIQGHSTGKYRGHWPVNVDPKTVSQYTGLRDKNGKEIYEGDILRYYDDDYVEEEYSITQVKFGDGAFYVDVPSGYGYDVTSIGWAKDNGTVYEIIGNIYENPELIDVNA